MLDVATANPPYRIGKSRTGLGLFATRTIKKGACIVEYTGTYIPTTAAKLLTGRYLFEISKKWTIDGASRTNSARYVNHSCKPNAEADDKDDRLFYYATRAITKGEEITIDYGEEYFKEFIEPVGCKCAHCLTKK